MAAPHADLGERRVCRDRHPPGLVVGEVQVHPIEAYQAASRCTIRRPRPGSTAGQGRCAARAKRDRSGRRSSRTRPARSGPARRDERPPSASVEPATTSSPVGSAGIADARRVSAGDGSRRPTSPTPGQDGGAVRVQAAFAGVGATHATRDMAADLQAQPPGRRPTRPTRRPPRRPRRATSHDHRRAVGAHDEHARRAVVGVTRRNSTQRDDDPRPRRAASRTPPAARARGPRTTRDEPGRRAVGRRQRHDRGEGEPEWSAAMRPALTRRSRSRPDRRTPGRRMASRRSDALTARCHDGLPA